MVEIDKRFTQSIVSGEGLSHHMEDKYYQKMGMCYGFVAMTGQELKLLEKLEVSEISEIEEAIISSESV